MREVVREGREPPLAVLQYARKRLVGKQPAHAGDDDDGEFQPFGGVHGHHAHGALAAALRKADVVAAALKPREKFGDGKLPALRDEARRPAHLFRPAGRSEEFELHARFGEDV